MQGQPQNRGMAYQPPPGTDVQYTVDPNAADGMYPNGAV